MKLTTLIWFVTSRCNARCQTCFYWKELNRPGDLTFEEIETLSRTMPPFRELWLSGGEPMMRPRLGGIIEHFYRQNGIRTLNLPTNGLFQERVLQLMEHLGRTLPELDVNLNVALDGFEATHDRIRGVPGNFCKAVGLLEALSPLRNQYPNLRVHVNSVITSQNLQELEALAWWLIGRVELDGQYFQVLRGDAKNPDLKKVDRRELLEFYRRIRPVHEYYGRRLAARHGGVKGWWKRHYYVQTLLFHYSVQGANLESSSPWPMPCRAGETILVIDANGDVRACELRGKVSNLRQVDCDFRQLYPSPEMGRETEQIVKDQCWCTHVCFIHDSLKSSPRVRYYEIPLAGKGI